MHRIMVAGIGTGVGKTVVSGVLTTLLKGDYWKPIQCGDEDNSDTAIMKKWLDLTQHSVHPPTYSFKEPLSPHHAASLENTLIRGDSIELPKTKNCLVIEGVGGIFVPLTKNNLTIDLFKRWNCLWVVVSKHYLGSINHTLLTIQALYQQNIFPLGIFFNGFPSPDSEEVILEITRLPFLGRLLPEEQLTKEIIKKYAKEWKPQLLKLLP